MYKPITPITWNGELPLAEQATLKVHPEYYTSIIKYYTSITRTILLYVHYTNHKLYVAEAATPPRSQ